MAEAKARCTYYIRGGMNEIRVLEEGRYIILMIEIYH